MKSIETPDSGWEHFPHEADMGVRGYGPSQTAAFEQVALALTAVITDLEAIEARYRSARGLLLDSYDPGAPGGTGRGFDWNLVPSRIGTRIVLAGGLNAGNVAEAIRRVGPWGVDVSGGVESAKGIKDRAAMAAFMQGVRDGDQSG